MYSDAFHGAVRVEGLPLSCPETQTALAEDDLDYRTKRRGKYHQSLQLLKPFRITHKHQHPVDNAGLFSFMTLHWLSSLAWKAHKASSLMMEDIWGLSCHEAAETNFHRLQSLWHAELKRKGKDGVSLRRVFWRFCRTRFLVALFFLLIFTVTSFIGPALLIRALLEYAQSSEVWLPYGLALVGGIFFTELIRSWTIAFVWAINYRTAARLRGAVLTFAFEKILRLRSTKEISTGELINICSNDGQRLYDAVLLGCLLGVGPLMGLLTLSYNIFYLGPTAIIGSMIFIIFYPLMMLASRLAAHFRKKCVTVTDRRVRLMNEILSSIKFIKMYCWESAFTRNVQKVRAEERKILEKGSLVHSLTTGVAPVMVVVASVCTFTLHMALGNDLTAAQAFTVVAVFNSMTFPLKITPLVVRGLSEATIAVKRFQRLFMMEDQEVILGTMEDPDNAVEFRDATLAWNTAHPQPVKSVKPQPDRKRRGMRRVLRREKLSLYINSEDEKAKVEEPKAESLLTYMEHESPQSTISSTQSMRPLLHKTLHRVQLSVRKGALVGVCGAVGSGKSSLLSALLGQMTLLGGSVAANGGFAYAAQQAWILNSSLRENILFGTDYVEEKYNAVLEACCLIPDISELPHGDMTEIGERGANLSGGQKQRVSLARALYSDRPILLLDDPLSAVDAHVASHLFHNAIRSAAGEKTVIFVTHQLQKHSRLFMWVRINGHERKYLAECDEVVLLKDGQIAEQGTHGQLVARGRDYAMLITSVQQENLVRKNQQGGEETDSALCASVISTAAKQPTESTRGDQLMQDEEKGQGAVTWAVYAAYIKAAGGPLALVINILFFLLTTGSIAFSDWWLSHWIKQGSGNITVLQRNESVVSSSMKLNPHIQYYSTIYALSMGVVLFFKSMRGIVLIKCTLRAASALHDKLFKTLLLSPMRFFDTTPLGRILNRFSKDMDEVDVRMNINLELLLQNMTLVFFCLALVSAVFPWFLFSIIPLAAFFYILCRVSRLGITDS
ncbi:hypothetical protein QTP70_028681, partial [Hemibagrus guttatus]